jgi:hypothetical protein
VLQYEQLVTSWNMKRSLPPSVPLEHSQHIPLVVPEWLPRREAVAQRLTVAQRMTSLQDMVEIGGWEM